MPHPQDKHSFTLGVDKADLLNLAFDARTEEEDHSRDGTEKGKRLPLSPIGIELVISVSAFALLVVK